MAPKPTIFLLAGAILIAGCSGIRFTSVDDGKSHPYRVASPALKVITDPDCKMTAEVISIPGRFNYLSFQTGLGKIDNSVEFEPGGTIKTIKAKQEGVAEDLGKVIGAVTGAVTSAAGGAGPRSFSKVQQAGCPASVRIYPIKLDPENNPYVAEQPLLSAEGLRLP